ncbi:hypothetical protein [Nemorincola caseinilytica]
MNWLRKISFACTLAAIIGLLTGCGPAENVPDTSAIKVDLKTQRFDVDLYAIDTSNIAAGLHQLRSKYPDFLDYFLDTLMAYEIHGNYNDTVMGIREGLKPFLVHKDYRELEDYIKKQYPDTKKQDEQLTGGFKLLKYYYPQYKVPRIMYLNMGLSKWTSFLADSATQCVGLDMFLGDDYPHYFSVGLFDYMYPQRRASYLPVAVFTVIYRTAIPLQTQEKNLLELMLQKGKEQYFLHKILPQLPDSVLFGFQKKQMEWCQQNEAYIYNFFVKNQLIYSKEVQNTIPYITDGPFARGMEPPSNPEKFTPGNIGTWLGYKMICAYMDQHKELTMPQLLQTEFNSATFLAEAKYKPR